MINLFNIPISQIKHNGDEVLLIKLNGDIIYDREKFCVRYTVKNTSFSYLNDTFTDGNYTNFPKVYTSKDSYITTYDVHIAKTDGTVLMGTLSELDLAIPCSSVKEIIVWYPSSTYKLEFGFKGDTTQTKYCRIEEIKFCNTSNFNSLDNMFSNCDDLIKIKSINWNTSNVTDMSYMMYNSYPFSTMELDLSKFNTSKVTDMSYMFYWGRGFEKLDVSKFNTSNVTNMSNMFYYCDSLTALDVSKFDTSNVTNMSNMFYYCDSLTALDVSKFDTSNVTDMSYMFGDCSKLTTLNLRGWGVTNELNWNTSKVTRMAGMFNDCDSLTVLDLSSWDVGNVTSWYNMFTGCENLTNFNAPKNIKISIFFDECPNLTHDSLMSIINNLATVTSTKTLTLGDTNRDKLTPEEVMIAVNKGWTIR